MASIGRNIPAEASAKAAAAYPGGYSAYLRRPDASYAERALAGVLGGGAAERFAEAPLPVFDESGKLNMAGIEQSMGQAGDLMFLGSIKGAKGLKGGTAPPPQPAAPTGAAPTPEPLPRDYAAGLKIGGEEDPTGMYDLSYATMHQRPDVPQSDLPRFEPPRGISPRLQAMMANPKVKEELVRYAQAGGDIGKGWYNLQQLREQFVAELGETQGDGAFRRFVTMMSATSPRSKLPANIKNASFYYHRSMGGEELKPGAEALPDPNWIPPEGFKAGKGSGYGHLAQNLHVGNVREAMSPEGWDVYTHPKPPSYGENLYGNWKPATIDAHAIKLPAMIHGQPEFLKGSMSFKKSTGEKFTLNPAKDYKEGRLSIEDAQKKAINWEDQPRPNEYPAMERWYKDIADELGMDPAQFQASIWVGGGKRTGLGSDEGKTALGFFADSVMRTAKARGVEPRGIVRDFIRGKIPLLSIGGAAVTLASLNDEQRAAIGLPKKNPPKPASGYAKALRPKQEVY